MYNCFQVILHQTKGFNCLCKRCQDPEELGAPLGGLKCKNKSANCFGAAYPLDPLNLESDLGIILNKMSMTTIFGHNHLKQKFNCKY